MAQADNGTRQLQRMAIQLSDKTLYRFQVNPQNYTISRPQRTSVFKTRTHVIVEDYGPDIPTIKFSGTTGLRKVNGKSGADRLKELQAVIARYANAGHAEGTQSLEMYFHNFTDGESYAVHLGPEGISVERNAERPLLYDYTINLLILREATQPSPDKIDLPATGNYGSSIGYRTTSEIINPNSNFTTTGPPVDMIEDILGSGGGTQGGSVTRPRPIQ